MVDVLDLPSRGDYLAQGLTQGLGSLLEGIAQRKAGQMQQQQKKQEQEQLARQYEQMGLPPGLASLDPSLQREIIKQMGQESRQQQIMSLLGGGGGVQQQAGEEMAEGQASSPGYSDEQILQISQLDPNLGRALQSQKKQEFQEKQFEQRTKEQAYKLTQPLRKEVGDAARSAKTGLMRVGRMKKLVDEGDLGSPLWNSIVKKYFGDAPFLKTTSAQEFEKLAIDALEGAPSRFGGRVTEFLAETFLRGIPNLLQTDEGKRRVARNLEILESSKILRFDAMNEVIAENGGVPPLDLEEQIDSRIADQLDALAEEFIYNPAKPGEGLTSSGSQRGGREISKDEVIMITPDGKRRAVNRKDAKAAKKAGYRIG